MKNVRRNGAGHVGQDALEADRESDAKLMVQQLANDICNIVFMDIDIPGLTPMEAASIVKAAYPEVNVLLFTMNEGKELVESRVVAPLAGTPPAAVTGLVARVYEAAVQTNMTAVQKVLAFFNRHTGAEMAQYGLSPRELQVLDCLVNGDTYKKIAEHCHISVGTVRSHIMNIYRKLEVNSRSGAIVKALHERLLQQP